MINNIQYMEIWKDIPEYEGYYKASSLGRIKSIHFNKERILKPNLTHGGYQKVVLSKNKNTKTYRVHQLIAITFLNHKKNGMIDIIDHIDNDKLNNRVDNLQITNNRHNSTKDKRFAGISLYKNGKWTAGIRIKNKEVHLGFFDTKEKALQTYKKAVENVDKYKGDNLNFRVNILGFEYKGTSNKKGVYWDKSKSRWIASVFIDKKRIYLGSFKTEQEAVNARRKSHH